MVMELFGGVTVDLNNLPANPNRRVKPRVKPPRLRTCTGEKFGQIWEGPRTQLKQIEVCRIFWHLVGGFAEMAAAGVRYGNEMAAIVLSENVLTTKAVTMILLLVII